MRIKNNVVILIVLASIGVLSGCTSTQDTQINVLATTDLHGEVPYNMVEYINSEREKDQNISLVDAGDFLDSDGDGAMNQYMHSRYNKESELIEFENKYIEFPLAKDMKDVGYDAVVLGNHEFVSNNKFYLDNMIADFEKNKVDVLSANTYKANDESYVKPYIIKEIETKHGIVKLGILGLTIKEVDERKLDEDGNRDKVASRELKDMSGYDGTLYMNDLVEDAKKWAKVMKEKEDTDIIVAVAHSGEKPKKPRNPGNRIQELAQDVEGIDAIVAGHTHKAFEQHDYKNKSGDKVIVTQPGKHGECISKITFELEKNKYGWNVKDKYVKITEFEENNAYEYAGNFIEKVANLTSEIKEVNLKDLTSFEWDKVYVFDSSVSVEEMYEKVGYKWKSLAKKEEGYDLQVVFMKDEKVVSYLVVDSDMFGINMSFDKKYYKNNIIEIEPNKNDKFSVKKGKEVYETYLNYIGK